MHVVAVTPLIKGTQLESLSYFSSVEYDIGSFIEVPIRGKNQMAIVTEVKPVSSTKTALKAATFSLRKLPVQENVAVLPLTLRQTAKELSKTYPTSIGSIIYSLLPPDVRNGSRHFPSFEIKKQDEETTPQILTARHDERFLVYQSHVRSVFAKKGSVLIVVPTASEIKQTAEKLANGIKEKLIILSPLQTKKQRDNAYEKLEDITTTKLIITTPAYAYFERQDLTSVIIEQSASSNFVTRTRPYLDHRISIKIFTKLSGRSIIFGDTVPRTEDEVARRDEIFLTYDEEVKRIAFTAPLSIIKLNDKPRSDSPFRLFSDELIKKTEATLERKGRVFFFAARRGLAPVVACIDCGHIFRCPDSGTPYTLLRTFENNEEVRWFVSSASGRRVKAEDICSKCGSWRLRERGIGIQQVQDEWLKLNPNSHVTVLDQSIAKTAKQAEKIAKDFFSQKSGLLIGTQLALPYLQNRVDLTAIISLDATRAIPTWRADETLFRLLLKFRECSNKEVLVQTRTEPDPLITYASRGALERFYDDEISLREQLLYPPFATFYLLTWTGANKATIEMEKNIKQILRLIDVQYYVNPNSTLQKTHRHALIRSVDNSSEAKAEIVATLRQLPPYVKVEVNPDRIV